VKALAGWLIFSAFSAYAIQSVAQDSGLPPVTRTIYLKNATVIPAPGQKLLNTSILIDDGRIQTVGGRTPIPSHARSIACDSLYIYAGFIEGLSYTGTEAPKQEDNRRGTGASDSQDRIEVGNPPNDRAGITPEKPVRESLKEGEKSIGEMRKLGFTMAHVVPRGRMLPGEGAILLMRDGSIDEMLLREHVSVFAQFTGAPQMYPATVIGVMAKWRQLYRQAQLAKTHQQAFQKGAAIERPTFDRATMALIPVTEGILPVFFRTSSSLDISRALALQQDLGFKLVLAETRRADKMTEAITAGKFPVLVSLELPEDKSDDKSKGRSDADSAKADTTVVDTTDVTDPVTEALEKRRQQSLEENYRQASVLADAKIAFGFSTLGVKAKDIFPNLRKMIAHGLSEDQALAALTVNSAKLLHLESLTGTIEPGKLANLVITTGPVFDEKSQIRYVIVDGQLHEYEIKPAKSKKKGKDAAVKASGVWKYTVEIADNSFTGKITITESDDALQGYYIDQSDGVSRDLSDISLDGNRLKFKSHFETDGQLIPLDFSVVIDGDTFEGEVVIEGQGPAPIEGKRTPE
jgi:imidazolonepropionase-like amidohydrolase